MSAEADEPKRHGSFLDPRTKLLLVVAVAVVLLTGGYGGAMDVVRPVLAITPLVLLIVEGKLVLGAVFTGLFMLCLALQALVQAHLNGVPALFALLICGFFLRVVPGITVAYYVLSTTTINELVASLERMHVPQVVIIPLSVMFRFIPTLGEEIGAINRAVKMRGMRFGKGHPLAAVEYRLVPFMMCSVRIGEELSAAALTRGLGAPVRRTSISEVGFHVPDAVVALICIVCLSTFVLVGVGVL